LLRVFVNWRAILMTMQDDSLSRGMLATGQSLALGALRGLWPLDALDTPPRIPNDVRSINVRNPAPYRNLARDWIAANPTQWDALLKQHLEAEQTPTS
jgi:hypothetical protein